MTASTPQPFGDDNTAHPGEGAPDDRSARVRRMGLHDVPFAVQAHLEHFPEGFFARLGPRFLTRYYRTFIEGPPACALVAESDGQLLGYLTGIFDPQEHRRLVVQYHGKALAADALLGMVRRPAVAYSFLATRARRYLSALRRYRSKAPTAAGSSGDSCAVLSHVVVTKSERARGLGAELVSAFLAEATGAGCTKACLVTMDGPDGAGPFYERLGWRRSPRSSSADGRPLLHYEIDLGRTAGSDA